MLQVEKVQFAVSFLQFIERIMALIRPGNAACRTAIPSATNQIQSQAKKVQNTVPKLKPQRALPVAQLLNKAQSLIKSTKT